MIEDHLRELVSHTEDLSPESRRRIRNDLLDNIQHDGAMSSASRRVRSRRLVAGIAAILILVTSGVAAAATVIVDRPNADQASRVLARSADDAKVHLDGWRPSLRAESVACRGPDDNKLRDPREIGDSVASEFPLHERLTPELLIAECTNGTDTARNHGGYDPARATVCIREGMYPLAVVALDNLPCEDTAVGLTVRPAKPEDFVTLNRMRAIEVAILADPEECPTSVEAANWARTQLDAYDEHLTVVSSRDTYDGCYGSQVLWELGQVEIEFKYFPDGQHDVIPSGTLPPK